MRKLNVLIIIALLFLGFGKAGAQFKNLLLFDTTNANYPQCHLDIVGNVMYGMTEAYGTYNRGTVFSIHKDGSNYKSLHSFDDTDGAYPYGSVLVSGKKIYGMTHSGGLPNELGVIFSMDTDGTGYKVLYTFDFTYGEDP
ncbi:MAG TPA: choice-of-anchor tandem repeat GloVer-containing protein, partial [Bacteroidia bacterium]|nr:choice-of-anchor tandem repeat GloVer-containing protein [Bacteroidia bacterium]